MLLGYYLDLFQLRNQQTVYEKNIEQTHLLVKDMRAAYQQGTVLLCEEKSGCDGIYTNTFTKLLGNFRSHEGCEIGLETNSGIPYISIIYLVDKCTTPVGQ